MFANVRDYPRMTSNSLYFIRYLSARAHDRPFMIAQSHINMLGKALGKEG